ncbi:MAG: hypothetical protein LBQ42_12620 [Synergistaceae bacterium]|jgi:hypothetical protein|nr:hypothetical protein [Synergistaceae bacterium]
MKISDVIRSPREDVLVSGYDFEESYRLRKMAAAETKAEDAALRKVEEVKDGNVATTLEMMDRHNEMVKKSQELSEAKARQRAIERQNTQRREEHSELLAEMAVRNAQRRDLLEAARLTR